MEIRIRILIAVILVGFIFSEMKLVTQYTLVEEPVSVSNWQETEQLEDVVEDAPDGGGTLFSVSQRLAAYERQLAMEKAQIEKERDEEREALGLVVLADGSVLYMTLDDVKAHLDLWFTEAAIKLITRVVMVEDLIAHSETIWAAHVWCVLNRLDSDRFPATIKKVLMQEGQFASPSPLKPDPEVEKIVRDVLARYVYEGMGAPEEAVGRVLPKDICYFKKGDDKYNYFYRYIWGGRYDPFTAEYNPYSS